MAKDKGKNKDASKNGERTAIKPAGPQLVAQPHGGAIKQGGNPGNRGGMGAIPSLLRQRLRNSAASRLAILEEIADGTATEEIDVPLGLILPHAQCPKCGDQLRPKDAASLATVSVKGKASARATDRRGALDTLLKYGLGEKLEVENVSREDVAQRLSETYAILKKQLTRQDYIRIAPLITAVWEGTPNANEERPSTESVA